MPAKSKAQERYFQVAEHHPEQLRGPVPKMSKAAMHDFASGSMKSKPAHVAHKQVGTKATHRHG